VREDDHAMDGETSEMEDERTREPQWECAIGGRACERGSVIGGRDTDEASAAFVRSRGQSAPPRAPVLPSDDPRRFPKSTRPRFSIILFSSSSSSAVVSQSFRLYLCSRRRRRTATTDARLFTVFGSDACGLSATRRRVYQRIPTNGLGRVCIGGGGTSYSEPSRFPSCRGGGPTTEGTIRRHCRRRAKEDSRV